MFLFQVPPTPTPFSGNSEIPDLTVPDSWMWETAPDVVGVWNSANSQGFLSLVQVFALAVFAILFIGLVLMIIRQVANG